jgi:hypothetical protein
MKLAVISFLLASSIVAPEADHLNDFCYLGMCGNYWQNTYQGDHPVDTANSIGLSKLSYRFCTHSKIINTDNDADKACKLSRAEVLKHTADANYITSSDIQEQIRKHMNDYGNQNMVAILFRNACKNIVKAPIGTFASSTACGVAGTGASPAWPY